MPRTSRPCPIEAGGTSPRTCASSRKRSLRYAASHSPPSRQRPLRTPAGSSGSARRSSQGCRERPAEECRERGRHGDPIVPRRVGQPLELEHPELREGLAYPGRQEPQPLHIGNDLGEEELAEALHEGRLHGPLEPDVDVVTESLPHLLHE